MRDYTQQLEELLKENKALYEKLDEWKEEKKILLNKLREIESERDGLVLQLKSQKIEINNLKKEGKAREKVMNDREKVLKNELNRNELFKNKLKGCKKNEQLSLIKKEFNELTKKNTILMRILNELTGLIGTDFEVLESLLTISDDTDYSILEEYLNSLKLLREG